jgi:hypothetical protein
MWQETNIRARVVTAVCARHGEDPELATNRLVTRSSTSGTSRLAIALALALICATTGCASVPVVPLQGDPFDFAALVGEWDGSYASNDGLAEGTIWFELTAGQNHAHGDVLMQPRGGTPYVGYGLHSYPWQYAQVDMPRLLMIRFVCVSRGQVDGVLEPYWDPACGCPATTTFRGDLADGKLRGTFVTWNAGVLRSMGRWSASRRDR